VAVSNHRSYRVEKEFGLIVGGVLVLFSAWWVYRGKFATATQITLPLGSLLVLLGLLWPRSLVLPNRAWMALATVLSYISTRIILAIVFFLILTPMGLIKRAMGWDPLNRRAQKEPSYWHPYPERQRDPRHYEKMY
jgi:saxitoxin biosynthesis operon SxtJ-like protein